MTTGKISFCLLSAILFLNWAQAQTPQNPIMFVTQVPVIADSNAIVSTFANQQGSQKSAPRGGDLYIRYPDGTLKNLTSAAGYGNAGFQGAGGIAVRDPSIHWSGQKAVFSMVIGSPAHFEQAVYFWQLYEITGLGKNDTPVITAVPNQPSNYNNVAPIYGTDERVIFTSDRPRNGQAHLYPQLDEYEEEPSPTGLWSLNPVDGDLFLMEHSPSGSFTPIIDSFGRVVFTRWDHLQRDQQADGDATASGVLPNGTFNYTSEKADAIALFNQRDEVFPAPRAYRVDLLAGTNQVGQNFNLFFPWMIEEDGTGMETLNHVGRHELHVFFDRSINDDPNVIDFTYVPGIRTNTRHLRNFFQIHESQTSPGLYFGTDAPEFTSHSSGQIVSLTGAPSVNADDMVVSYLTHPDTRNTTNSPSADHSGLYRDPLPTSDGHLIAAHASTTEADANVGLGTALLSKYDFRLKTLTQQGAYWKPSVGLTGGITKSVSWYDPDTLLSYNGDLWELQPVEVVARTKPVRQVPPLPAEEQAMLAAAGISTEGLQQFMRENKLALIVMRDLTSRDAADKQQPYNLKVEGSSKQTIGSGGKVYDIKFLQLFQGDQTRGIGMKSATDTPSPGRRVLATYMHGDKNQNPALTGAPQGSVEIAPDGSAAAFVPARRAMSWQLTDPTGEPVVRERYWLSFQPGEIRSCTSCHGNNKQDQASGLPPQNQPQALGLLLDNWKTTITPKATFKVLHATDGTTSVQIQGVGEEMVMLQRSVNLMSWEDVVSYTLTAPFAPVVYQDTNPGMKRAFYRLKRILPDE